MRKQFLNRTAMLLTLVMALSFSVSTIKAQSKDEIINGSYFVAFGRFANSGELTYWRTNLGSKNIQQMVSNHRDYIKSNQSEREQTVKRSYFDAFGWQPSADELKYWSGQNKTYAELMTNHINNWLNVYADKKEQVIRQSYYKVFGRNATADEVKYWKTQPTYSYVQLVAMHTTWKQQNQAKSQVTAVKPNINANGISTAGLSLQALNGVIAAGGQNVVAPGGANVVAAGGLNVIAPGGAN
ncbi:MAG: hypothetical protein JWQ27_2155 [Ferruginibacter sp.]|nr:hypothetical protein [Ferruginibacter sp.]